MLGTEIHQYCELHSQSWRLQHFMEETLRISVRYFLLSAAICIGSLIFGSSGVSAQDANFHNAPPSSAQQKNPYVGQAAAIAAGAKLYATNCSACHGTSGQGTGNIPAVSHGETQTAPDGEVFWFLTTGSIEKGMPAWGSLSEQNRWQIVAYLKSLKNSAGARNASSGRPAK